MNRRLMVAALAMLVLAMAALGAASQFTSRTVDVEAPTVDIYAAKNLVVATGGVKATTAEGTLTSDKMQAMLDDKDDIRSLDTTGNVKVDLNWVGADKKRRRVKAQAERGTYTVADRTIVLAGNVTGNAFEVETQRTVDLRGDRVTFFLRESRYRIEKARITFAEPEPPAETVPK